MDHDRIESIETKLAYIEKAVADLGGLVYEYGARVERLEGATREIVRRLSEIGSEKGPGLPAGERPPHY
ncbi:MAG: SlyX family protein [Spirochaetes bacterium]|nr:SlyX family protein [Spirochaetota bacterium]MBU1082090.1 SlyX family protein [Spirochaetota bacterium]